MTRKNLSSVVIHDVLGVSILSLFNVEKNRSTHCIKSIILINRNIQYTNKFHKLLRFNLNEKKRKSHFIGYSMRFLMYISLYHNHAISINAVFFLLDSFIVIIHKRNHVVCLFHCTLRTFFASFFPTDSSTLTTTFFSQ